MSNPPCQWPGCECEARGPRSKWCEKHRAQMTREASRKWALEHKERRREYRKKFWAKFYPENAERIKAEQRERYHANPGPALKRDKARRKAQKGNTSAWVELKQRKMQECPRLHLRALELPCGKHEICSGCERIGGRRVEFKETGFKFGRVVG